MAKQLIVVVHGVGVRAAGEGADLLAAALDTGLPPEPGPAPARTGLPLGPPRPGAFGWRRRSSDDFRLHEGLSEAAVAGSGVLHPSFPARLSRMRRFEGQQPSASDDERLIADFYWGDVAGTGNSVSSTLIGLARVSLGLVHVVRENAWTVFPEAGDKAQARWRMLARGAALAVHGPVFAINIVLFLGLLATALLGADGPLASLVAGAASLGLAAGLQVQSRTFLLRHMGAYLGALGLLLWTFVATDRWGVLAPLDARLAATICGWSREPACHALYRDAFLHGLRLQALMVLLWGFASLVALALGLRWFGALLAGRECARRDLLAPTLSLMSLLWFTLIGLVWAAVGATAMRLVPEVFTSDVLFTPSQRGILAVAVTLAVLVLVGVAVLAGRSAAARPVTPETYMQAPDAVAERLRLVVPAPLRLALLAMPVAILILIWASIALRGQCSLSPEAIPCRADGWTRFLLSGALAGIGLAGAFLLRPLAQGIAVAGDVIIYLNDFHWRKAPDASPALTWAEALAARLGLPLPMRAPDPGRSGYLFRRRIEARLVHLVEDLIAAECPDRIDIVSHSQGTVIALDVLYARGALWSGLGQEGPQIPIGLVTMGSPWRHLYGTYFPARFPAPGPLPGVERWTNIFRTDDFIGTHVGQGHWPEEVPVGPGGHTNYLSDARVRPVLQERLAFP